MNDKDIIDLYLAGLSTLKIAKQLGLPKWKPAYILKKNNIVLRSNKINSKKFQCDDYYFKKIDSEEKAYWLGFIYADGYITKPNIVAISLAIKDKEHLQKINNCLKSTYKIKEYIQSQGYNPNTSYCRLSITSDQLFSDLNKAGCLLNKSLILQPPVLDKELIIHFIRGYFDGDGSWAISNKDRIGFSFKLCGTKEILNFIQENLNTKSKLYKRKKDNKNNYYISVSGWQVMNIMNKLYLNSSIYLDRKYKLYLQAKSRYEEIHK